MRALLTPPLEEPAGVEGLLLHDHPLLPASSDQLPNSAADLEQELRAADVAAC